MQADDVIWQIINTQFCSFKVTLRHQGRTSFCRNEYNVTGLCNRISCPLANSRYATVREDNGVIYLYMKTIERAHSPANLWVSYTVGVRDDYTKSAEIDEHLMHWPAKQIHSVKQRLTKLHQYLIRMKKLMAKPTPKLVAHKKKYVRREDAREQKALVAARLDTAIKKELLERLKNNTYGDLYNINPKVFNEVMDSVGDDQVTYTEGDDLDEEEMEEELDGDIEDLEVNEEDEEDDEINAELEDELEGNSLEILKEKLLTKLGKRARGSGGNDKKKRKAVGKIEIEYEQERENPTTTTTSSW